MILLSWTSVSTTTLFSSTLLWWNSLCDSTNNNNNNSMVLMTHVHPMVLFSASVSNLVDFYINKQRKSSVSSLTPKLCLFIFDPVIIITVCCWWFMFIKWLCFSIWTDNNDTSIGEGLIVMSPHSLWQYLCSWWYRYWYWYWYWYCKLFIFKMLVSMPLLILIMLPTQSWVWY